MAYPYYPNIDLNYNIPFDRVKYNVRYGPHSQQRLNIYKGPVQNENGNAVIVYMHGGGWGSNDKTRTVEDPGNVQKALFSYLMDPTWASGGPDSDETYTVDYGVDIVSIEWRQWHYTGFAYGSGTRSDIYEEAGVYLNDQNSTGDIAAGHTSYPVFMEDPQLAVQWVKDNASKYGFDSTKVFLWGTSAGGNGALVAGLRPSRRFIPKYLAQHKFDRFSNSNVIGILNWYGQISMSPWYFWPNILGPAFGIIEGPDAQTTNEIKQAQWRTRRDMERILLLPDASGSYSPSSQLSPLCKSISPSSMIEEFPWVRKAVKIYSTFMEWEDTLAPGGTLSGNPTYEPVRPDGVTSPWWGGGHEWRQLYDLSSVCGRNAISHDGKVVRSTGSIYPASAITSAGTYNLLGNNTLILSSFAGGQVTVTFPNSTSVTTNQVISSIVVQASSVQLGATLLNSRAVIRTGSGTNQSSLGPVVTTIYTGSAAQFSIIDSPAVSRLGLTTGTYQGSSLNAINQIYNPINHNGYFYESIEFTLKREMPRLYQWIKKTCGQGYINDSLIWTDSIK